MPLVVAEGDRLTPISSTLKGLVGPGRVAGSVSLCRSLSSVCISIAEEVADEEVSACRAGLGSALSAPCGFVERSDVGGGVVAVVVELPNEKTVLGVSRDFGEFVRC